MNGRVRWTGWLFAFFLGIAALPATIQGGEPTRLALPELVLLAPGTRVEGGPPKGWSDLILKSIPKLESGDVDSLPSFAGATATLFRSVILADVRPTPGERPGYRLARIGLGLCVPSKGVDTIVTRKHVAAGHVTLGLIERKVLHRAEDELKKARLVARSDHFAVLAAPSSLLVNGKHEEVYLFYALCVDPKDGKLSVLLWAYTAASERPARLSSLALLPPKLVYQCGLDVKADRLLGALPVNWSFAMRSLPQGTRLTVPPTLRPWLTDPKRIGAETPAFETNLRALLPAQPSITHVERHSGAK